MLRVHPALSRSGYGHRPSGGRGPDLPLVLANAAVRPSDSTNDACPRWGKVRIAGKRIDTGDLWVYYVVITNMTPLKGANATGKGGVI